MTNKLKELYEKVSDNEELAEQLKTISNKDEVIDIAKKHNIELTEQDFNKIARELDMDELENVSGGDDCYCFLGGGGSASGNEDTYACVAAGIGMNGKSQRCGCAAYGQGH